MNYQELIARILQSHTVYKLSKLWGINQPRLHRYVSGETLPDFDTAWKMAEIAGVEPEEAFRALAAEQRIHAARGFKLQKGFVQIETLVIGAGASIAATLSILCKIDKRTV